jgi:hypothetical protein
MSEKLLVLLEGTFIGPWLKELAAIIEAGEFVDPKNVVEDGEEVIGEMTELEKGLYTQIDRLEKEWKGYCLKCQEETADLEESEREDREEHCEHKPKIHQIQEQRAYLNAFMWEIIKKRLPHDHDTTGVRAGFKIVAYNDNPLSRLLRHATKIEL